MDKSGAGGMKSCNAPCVSEDMASKMWGGTERVNQRCKVKTDGGGEREGRENDRGGGRVRVCMADGCVTERKVHCRVGNALKTDIKTCCPTHTVTAPLSPFLLYSPPFCSPSRCLHLH